MTDPMTPDPDNVWRWAENIMQGEGASLRSGLHHSPVMHLLAGDDKRMWCSGGKALAGFVPVKWRPCPTCMTLAREMFAEIGEDA